MAYLLFIDESGQDRVHSPYEVLAGVSVEDSRIWPLIRALQDAEEACFGCRIRPSEMELKAKKLLKRKTFKIAAQDTFELSETDRAMHARAALEEGRKGRDARHSHVQLVSLCRAKLAYCERVFEICAQHQVRTFASIVDRDAPRTRGSGLRKDYSYLFERFYVFLDNTSRHDHGLIVFDELEHIQSHILIEQMSEYFKKTQKGRLSAGRILPEPLFVHSDMTTLIRVADLLAYIVAWGVRLRNMDRPRREELSALADMVLALRFKTILRTPVGDRPHWSFKVIDDLRYADEKLGVDPST